MDLFSKISATLLDEKDSNEFAILSREECEILIMSLAISRGEEGFTEEEAAQVIKWAQEQRIGYSLLELTLKGLTNINLTGDNEPTFSLTDEGKQSFEGDSTHGYN